MDEREVESRLQSDGLWHQGREGFVSGSDFAASKRLSEQLQHQEVVQAATAAADGAKIEEQHEAFPAAYHDRKRLEDVSRRTSETSDEHLQQRHDATLSTIAYLQKREEGSAMMSTSDGRATLFVHKVNEVAKRITRADDNLQGTFAPLGQDDAVFLAKRMMDCQETFRFRNKPTHITIAYHYTHQSRLKSIRENGLMSGLERETRSIRVGSRAAFGHGIYTADNPFAFQSFGDTGLVVAILKGSEARVTGRDAAPGSIDTVVGNKDYPNRLVEPPTTFRDEIVVRNSCQCLPLIKFSTTSISSTNLESIENRILWQLHVELQDALDSFFNGGIRTTPKRVVQPATRTITVKQRRKFSNTRSYLRSSASLTRSGMYSPLAFRTPSSHISVPLHSIEDTITYSAPSTMVSQSLDSFIQPSMSHNTGAEKCSICLEFLARGSVVRVKRCGHRFHDRCIRACMEHENRCPICRSNVFGEPRGKAPSGTMTAILISAKCPGFAPASSIQITYKLEGGTQLAYHANPGQTFKAVTRTAYLPDNTQGRKLLKRLKYAFARGMSFCVGDSLSTGATSVITWSSIPHKTSLVGGVHGFPDPLYILNCNDELDALGVPASC